MLIGCPHTAEQQK